MARLLGFDHRPVLFTFHEYLAGMAPSIIASESFTDCGVPQYLLFREIGRHFRVAFNGEGADELFGGYPEHWHADRYLARIRDAPRSIALTEGGSVEREKLLSVSPVDCDAWMLEHFLGSQLTDRHLHPLDKFGMSASVEVRVPYLDYELATYVRRLPAEWRINRRLGSLKYILRRVYLRRWKSLGGAPGLLDAALRQKLGFPDARRSSERRFHQLCDGVLPERYLSEHPRRQFLSHRAQAFWFDMFHFLFCEHRGVLPADFDAIDFLAQRAGKRRSDVASVVAAIGDGTEAEGSPTVQKKRVQAAVSRNHNGAAAAIEQRLSEILAAVGGTDVQTNGAELWFATESTDGLEIRLAADIDGPCFDHSANFAISYGGGASDEPPSPAFQAVVDRIKAIDQLPIADAAAAFEEVAATIAGDVSPDGDDEAELEDSGAGAASGNQAAQPGAPRAPFREARWERYRTRELNVVFLDLCAQLIGKRGETLPSLHWGFWPTDSSAVLGTDLDVYDPFEAFSENLLAHVPDTAKRILDVGCGLGANARLLSARNKLITAVSPVAHHCAAIEQAKLPGVEVKCARFEEMRPEAPYDLLLFSESLNHFSLDDEFFAHCRTFLADAGFVLMADDLTAARAARIAAQRVFRVVRTVDISENVAPTGTWWAQQMRAFAACREAWNSILEIHDTEVARRVSDILDTLDSSELRVLLSGRVVPPESKGHYLIYLLQAA
jgi:2-polyprenyl-3-methyl-5-hydroxy-6-metoxy-1,4-benzoquinol methylase